MRLCAAVPPSETGSAGHQVLSRPGGVGHQHAHDEHSRHAPSSCDSHLAKAFQQYGVHLDSARRVCRTILGRGRANSLRGEQLQPESGLSARNLDRHRSAGTGNDGLAGHSRPHHQRGAPPRGRRARQEHVETKAAWKKEGGGRNGSGQGRSPSSDDTFAAQKRSDDLEKACGLDRVSLAVDGMTCSGCSNKLERALRAADGVSSARANFVMGCAEFCHDASAASSSQIVRAAERATGFRCTELSSDDQTIDLLAGSQSVRALADVACHGVTHTTILGKDIVRVSYDPTVVGARALMHRIGTLSRGLASPCNDPAVSRSRRRLYRQLVKTTSAFCFTIPVAVLAWSSHRVSPKTAACVALVLASAVQLIAVPEFYLPAISAVVHSGALEMDMLVVVSITAAYTYSVVAFGFLMAGRPLETHAFFETSALLISLVLLGRLVAAYARIRAVAAVSMRSLQPNKAVIVHDGIDVTVDARLLQYGDTLRIEPHTIVPTDAIVLTGSSEVDESMMTGESIPVFKSKGHGVIAGTVNGSGVLTASLTRLPGRNTVTDIARLVEETTKSKPRLQDTADRVASWFVPVVASLTLVVVVVWILVGLKVSGFGAGEAVSNAITYAVATLAVSCPCALGLAVPMVLVVAGGIAARNGVIIKSAQCTELARKVTDVVLDKTGTITESVLDVAEEHILGPVQEEAVSVSKALVTGNRHPVSLAIARHLEQHRGPTVKLASIHVIPGAGVQATLDGTIVQAGSPEWTKTLNHPIVSGLQEQGMTLLVVARDAEPMAVFGLRTRLRVEAKAVVAQLTSCGIHVHLVSGDQRRAVDAAAAQVGISRVVSHCTPAAKRDYVARLMDSGRTVMFVGDGTNDAVAVVQADVGVQLASVESAGDITRGAADVVLLNGLDGIPFLLHISAVSFRRIVFNFMWSAAYNMLAILLASGALVKVRIPPAYAGLGEIVSVLPVILAATTMLLKRSKKSDVQLG